MRFPPFIKSSEKKGSTIGFPAPSFGCASEPYFSAFQNALRKLKKIGFQTVPGPNAYADEGIGISNTPEKCAHEFMEMYCDPDTDALISCGGGELMCEILPFIDFDKLKREEPKWFMGYSDNTNLTFLLATLSDTASVYGPCAAAFGMEPWHPALEDALGVLTGEKKVLSNYPMWEKESKKDEEHPLLPYHVTEPFCAVTDSGEEVELSGRLLGGCLDCLSNLVGTPYDRVEEFANRYREDGILWFLESCDLNVMDMRRTLFQLREAGWFTYVSGFLIGRPLHFHEPMMGLDQYDAVKGALASCGVPIVMDLDIGHMAPMMPLVCGSYAVASLKDGRFEIRMDMDS